MAGSDQSARALRGVNLGHWLVLERWMEADQQTGPFSLTAADDEHGLRKELDHEELARRLQAHRDSYVTADTISFLAEHGCKLLRIPVPFHVFGDETHEGCIAYLDRAMRWAEQERLSVLVDLHTVPGGQNGFDNSGYSGLCTWHKESAQMMQTLEVLERLALRYAGHPALWGIEVMNEPASPSVFRRSMKRYGSDHPGRVERSLPIPHAVLEQFYKLAYERLHPILGRDVALVFHDQFQLEAWDRFLPASHYPNVWIDTHQYIATAARMLHARTLRAHIALTRVTGARIARAQRHHPILVGEWSLSQHIRGLDDAGEDERCAIYRRYATEQLAAFDRGAGNCFWSLRNGTFDDWSFEASLQNNWLDFRTM